MKKIILLASVIMIGLIFYSVFSAENINSLEGGFSELAFARNENNTGPIKRVYAFTVKDTSWSEMKKHTDLLPHTKYGTTEVYYFLEGQSPLEAFSLSLEGLPTKFQKFCIAHIKKNGQGSLRVNKYPF
jgi:hypothetical protein